MKIFAGEITEAPGEAICTSTNPRLSLMMGTGGAVRDRGGFEILRACEDLLQAEAQKSGRSTLPAGSAHLTTAGSLPYKGVIHCVASNTQHDSSEKVIRACVRNALQVAQSAGFASLAMPVFATGHARIPFEKSLRAMAEVIRSDASDTEVIIVVRPDRAEEARKIVDPARSG